MKGTRTSSIVTGTLVGILGFIQFYGCNNKQASSQIQNNPPSYSQKENITELQIENKGLIIKSKKLKSGLEIIFDDIEKQNYPVNVFENILEDDNIKYNKKALEKVWQYLSETEKHSLFVCQIDPEIVYKSFTENQKKKYDEFFKYGTIDGKLIVSNITKKEKQDIIGLNGLDIEKSPLSLAFFMCYNNAQNYKIFIPAIR